MFSDLLNQKHPLYLLANQIDWQRFDDAFSLLYCADNGRPCKPIRLMCGLLILKHVRNLSDESVVEQWSENAYYQYFCGMVEFTPSYPCNASDLVHFRKRIGESGMELILAESIRVNTKDDDRDQRFRNHPKNCNKALKADRRLHTIAGRLVRDLKRNLGENHDYDSLILLFEDIWHFLSDSKQTVRTSLDYYSL